MEPPTPTSTPPFQPPEPAVIPPATPQRFFKLPVVSAVIVIVLIGLGLLLLLPKSDNIKSVNGTLTVGSIPFVYPCAVAKNGDFTEAFGLSINVQDFHEVQETSVLSPSQLPAGTPPTSDLFKIIPNLTLASDSVDAECSLSGTVTNTKTIDSIQVELSEYATQSTAQSGYDSLLSVAESTNSTAPAPLSSVADSNFLEAPTDNGTTTTLTMLHRNNLVTFTYALSTGESLGAAEPKLAAFAQAVSKNLDDAKIADTPPDLTGTTTFVGKPLKDICRQINLLAVGRALGSAAFRPDHVIDNSIYGKGESAGSVSDCEVSFNTAHDRTTNKDTSNLGKYYGRKLTLRASTYVDNATAHAALESQQTLDQKGTTFSNLPKLGDSAYATTGTFNNPDGTTTVTTTYRILQADRVVSIIFAQPDNTVTNEQVSQIYKLIDNLLGK